MILKNTRLKNDLKKIVKTCPDLADILLFGSAVRGKEKPADIDILVIFRKKVNKTVEYEIKKQFDKYLKNVSIISKTEKGIIDPAFDARESVLFESISLIDGKNIRTKYGFTATGLFKYDFKDWTKLRKTKFYHALNGRSGKKGITDDLGIIKLSDGLLLVSLDNIEKLRDFLDSWEIEYRYIPLLLPKRMNRKKILE